MNAPSLFDCPHNGTPTSRAAAESVKHSAASMRSQILQLLRTRADLGLTCDDVEVYRGYRHQTASARIRELSLSGHIRNSGKTRKTRSGREAIVWVVAE